MSTLPLSDIVSVSVVLSPTSAVASSFDLGLIVGTSAVIAATTSDRVRVYSGTDAMITDGFTSSDAEYLAAQKYFSQSPKPAKVAIGRWDNANETALEAVQACRAANTDWYTAEVCGAAAADILAVAGYVEAAQPPSAQFATTADADVLNKTATAAGYETGGATPSTDIHTATSPTLQIAVDSDAYLTTPSYQSITLTPAGLTTGALIAAALQTAIRALGGAYAGVTVTYGTTYVVTSGTKGPLSRVRIVDGAANDVAASLKLGAANGATDTDGSGSVGLALQALGYLRTLTQYSTTTDAVSAIMGYAMGANGQGASSPAYTLAHKAEVGVTPEALTETQVAALKAQNVNYYASFGNTYNLFENGVMADGHYFDEVLGLDQLVAGVSTAVVARLASVAKIPQTEGGVTLLHNAIDGPCDTAHTSGFLAAGQWSGPPILSLNTGDTLPKGYVILSDKVSGQSAADKAARIAPTTYVCIHEAGAIQNVVISIQANQ